MDKKNSFILYTDMYEAISALPDLDCAQVFRMIFRYVKGEDPYTDDDKTEVTHMALVAFNFIKPHLDRNQERFEQTKKARAEAGKIGGLTKQANARIARQKIATSSKIKQTVANLAVNVNDNVNVKDISSKEDMVNKGPVLLAGSKVRKGQYGNKQVDYVIRKFTDIYDFPPTDRSVRPQAWNLVQNIRSTFKQRGTADPTEEQMLKGIDVFFDWVERQESLEYAKTLSVIRRNWPVFLSESGVKKYGSRE